ncbi:hypothetical protein LQW54_011854 [Pestalotiopsis sp. IQ-011]
MHNNFDNVDLDSDIVQSDWDSCGSNKSDDEWEYVDDKRVDTARGREGATRTFLIHLKSNRSEPEIPSPYYSDHENDLLTQDHFFDGAIPQHQGWNSTEQEHSTTNQQAFTEMLENYEYDQSLLPEVQPYDAPRSCTRSEKPAKGLQPTNHSAEPEPPSRPGESTGEWWDQTPQNTSASGVQYRSSLPPASHQYPSEEPLIELRATANLSYRNRAPQNRDGFDQWFEERFDPSTRWGHLPPQRYGPPPEEPHLRNVLSEHARRAPSSDHPPRTSAPSRPRQTDEGYGSGKENVPPKGSEPSRGRPATRRGHRPEYLDREPSRESRHHGGLSVQELILPYGTQAPMDALPEAPTTEAESPRPSNESREQNVPPTPRLAPRVRPDTPPGQDLLTTAEVSTGDEASQTSAPFDFSNTPADFQRWVEERDRERNRVHRRRIKKRYPRPQLPSTAVDTTSASDTGESRRSAISSDTVRAGNSLASLPRKPFSYQRMT